ncbi:MAG: antitoxin [Pseudomonadota bacterium]
MTTPLSPIVSEFETEEQAEAYDRWFRSKVQRSLDDPRPSVPHDDVMIEMRDLLERKRRFRHGG